MARPVRLDGKNLMKTVWVTRSFLDYRIPVYEEVSKRFNDCFVLIFNADYVPDRCCNKAKQVLGDRARGLRSELSFKFGTQNGFANKGLRFSYQRGLVKTILEQKPDILISDGFFQWTYSALWLRATRGIPHVMCYERTAHTERNVQLYRTTYRKCVMRWIDAICCNGRLCGEYTRNLGFPHELITYGHMVADVQQLSHSVVGIPDFQVTQLKSKLDCKGIVLMYVGQLIPRKGVMELLNAWKTLKEFVDPNTCSLLLVGDGSQKDQCDKFCRTHHLWNVHRIEKINYDHLPPYYKAADVLIMPTLEDNWSLVVPEAMACGLPIICSKYNGCWPELVRQENGWVFDPLKIDNMVCVLKECLDRRAILADMGEASKAIIKNHTATQAADAILEACRLATRDTKVH